MPSATRQMTPAERLRAAFDLQPVDRPPALAGWIADPAKIMALTGASEDEYWNDPINVSIRAYQQLPIDGLMDVNVPSERGGYTIVTHKDLEERSAYEGPDAIAEAADQLPSPDEVLRTFDPEAHYQETLAAMQDMQRRLGEEMQWIPARWELIPNFEWYRTYGYENYLMAIKIYPDHVLRLFEHSAAVARCKGRTIARLVREGLHPRAMLCGMDICGTRGPLVDPGWLREHYFPLVRSTVAPLLDAGIRLVWHCDGDIRPIFDDLLGLGLAGFQGFQDECGVRYEEIIERRTIRDEKLIIFGPISVTTTLVQGTPADVRDAVWRAMRVCRDKASLVLMTSNEILPDITMENMLAMYEALDTYPG